MSVERISRRLMEVGAPSSTLLEETAPYFIEVYGCYTSEFAIGKANERNPEKDLRVLEIGQSTPHPDEVIRLHSGDGRPRTRRFLRRQPW